MAKRRMPNLGETIRTYLVDTRRVRKQHLAIEGSRSGPGKLETVLVVLVLLVLAVIAASLLR